MRRLLKDTFELWIAVIVGIVYLAALFGLQIFVLKKIGVGVWQIIACGLWVSFWTSFLITVNNRDVEKNVESEEKE